MNSLVSVIIPTYNAYKYIGDALDSVLKQTYDNYEIIIIDDGSTDNTDKIIQTYLPNDKIHYIKIKHSGLAAVARNQGIKVSRGSYIAFLDADDTWSPNKLKEQIELFDDHTALVYSDGEFIDQNRKYSARVKFHQGIVFDKLILKNFIATSSVVVKKTILDKVGLFSENPKLKVGEDYDLWLRISQKYSIDYSSKNLFGHRIYHESVTGNKKKAYQSLSYLFKKWLRKDLNFIEKFLFMLALILNYLKIIFKFLVP